MLSFCTGSVFMLGGLPGSLKSGGLLNGFDIDSRIQCRSSAIC
jgi:hypothetical protein